MLNSMFGAVENVKSLFGRAEMQSQRVSNTAHRGDDQVDESSSSENDDDNSDVDEDAVECKLVLHEIGYPDLTFCAPDDEFNYSSATEWRVLDPINNTTDRELLRNKVDPITQESLLGGDQDSLVVQLPCHSTSIPCLMFMDTAKRCLAAKSECPTCKFMFGHKVPGSQPSGTMQTSWTKSPCNGYPEYGTIRIVYEFPDGTQGSHHQSPNEGYSGAYREAFLPDNEVGRQSLALLQCAFLRGELFTIGTSLTNGWTNTTVWGSIHQKTSRYGGCHGYPDDGYFTRLAHECAAKGIFAISAHDELTQAVARTQK
jgi:hypothetical protein